MTRYDELVRTRIAADFVGRQQELTALLQIIEDDGPLIIHLHGIAGSGKSALLEEFGRRARATGATVIRLDCQAVEPTESGFLSEVAAATGGAPGYAHELAQRLGRLGSRVLIILDTYEAFQLMDSWLRQVFVPLLPNTVRVVLSGREPPATAWLLAPGWRGLFKAISLDRLDQESALQFLDRCGVSPHEARRLEGICHGHPLALTLAASLRAGAEANVPSSGIGEQVVHELSRIYIADIKDFATRRVLEAACVVRRVTVPLLAAMLPEMSPFDAQDRICSLPFVRADRDGLRIHDAVREAVAFTLRSQNPQLYRQYRRAAYHHFMSELHAAAVNEYWNCTANLLYVLENPVVREAFFPSGAPQFVIEPAGPEDEPRILEIIEQHERPTLRDPLQKWWRRTPGSFFVARDSKGDTVGFYCVLEAAQFPERVYRDDSVTRGWLEHLTRNPIPKNQCALFLRRWLAADSGEAPSAVQAACWLDLKRRYLELRPRLRRVYLMVEDLAPYAAVAQQLGFQVLPGSSTEYQSAMLDFGASSVDGWLARLVAAELGVEQDGLLDANARELVLNGKRVGLSRLEFGVMEYLQYHSGETVSRIALLENVWQQTFDGGSNVVDVVVRGLRKKLGENAAMVESVRGIGYRLRVRQ